jgi:hypothetical protein
MQKKIPDAQAYPILGKKNVLIFSREVHDWFNERSDFLSKLDMPHYFEQFSDIEEGFMSWFLPDTVRPILPQEQKDQRAKKWESTLQKASAIYQRAVGYAERSGTLKKKPKAPRASFDPKALVITYHDADKDIEQEFSLTRNTVLASVCEKMYSSCRQKGSFITPKELYEYLRSNQQKCRKWEPYLSSPLECWKRLYENVRSANRWSDKKFSQRLFSCDQERVTRLL